MRISNQTLLTNDKCALVFKGVHIERDLAHPLTAMLARDRRNESLKAFHSSARAIASRCQVQKIEFAWRTSFRTFGLGGMVTNFVYLNIQTSVLGLLFQRTLGLESIAILQ